MKDNNKESKKPQESKKDDNRPMSRNDGSKVNTGRPRIASNERILGSISKQSEGKSFKKKRGKYDSVAVNSKTITSQASPKQDKLMGSRNDNDKNSSFLEKSGFNYAPVSVQYQDNSSTNSIVEPKKHLKELNHKQNKKVLQDVACIVDTERSNNRRGSDTVIDDMVNLAEQELTMPNE
jgi:hypothetical protein